MPLEIALQTAPLETIKEAYQISEEEWEALKANETFRKQILKYQQESEEEGYTYRAKARLQAEELLKTSFAMIHDINTPPAVKADLIKFTARVAGYETPKQAVGEGGGGFVLNINIPGAQFQANLPVQAPLRPDFSPTTYEQPKYTKDIPSHLVEYNTDE